MSERTRNAIVGFTAVLGLVALGYLIIIFGEIPTWLTKSYPIYLHFEDASGIAQGTRVKLNGIDIGFVDSVEMKTPSYEGVVIRCQINQGRQIPVNATPLATAGLLGGAAQLNIKTHAPPDKMGEKFLPTDGTASLVGKTSGMTDVFADMASRLEKDLHEQLENFGRVSESIVELADAAKDLLVEQDLAEVEAGRIQGNLRTAIAHTDQGVIELRGTLKRVNEFVSDEMRNEVRGAITDFRGLATDSREKLAVLADRLVAVSDDVSKTLDSANALLEQARTGEGTLGKLMQDPQLYNSLQDAADRLTDTLREAKLLIQKWKAEGLPVRL